MNDEAMKVTYESRCVNVDRSEFFQNFHHIDTSWWYPFIIGKGILLWSKLHSYYSYVITSHYCSYTLSYLG